MQNDRPRHLLRQLRRAQFGRRSECLDSDQLLLALEDIEQAIAASEATGDKEDAVAAKACAEKCPRQSRRAARSSASENGADDQWIHVDVERAKQELPAQSTIAHGLLTVSLIPEFVRSVMGLQGIKNTLNYGANRIRYLAPVPAGSRLRGRISIKAADDASPNGLRVTYDITIEIEGGERAACVAEMIAVHYL